MNAKQSAKLNMFKAVTSQLSGEMTTLATVPALRRAFEFFVSKVSAISALIPNQEEGSTGESLTKEQARSILESAYDDLTDQVYAWAAENGDELAKQKADLTLSDIHRMKDAVLPAEAEAFYDFVVANKAALVDYGVTDETLAGLAQAIDDYSNAADLPRNKISKRSTNTDNLANLFAEADKLLNEQVKKLMVGLRKKHADLYNTFVNNCKIVDAPSASAKVKAANKAAKAAKKKPGKEGNTNDATGNV